MNYSEKVLLASNRRVLLGHQHELTRNNDGLKVLMIANGAPGVPPKAAGGVEYVMFYLTKWLSRLRNSVTLVDTLSSEERDTSFDMSYCRVIRLRHFNLARFHTRKSNFVIHELMRQIAMLTFSLKLLLTAPKILHSEKYDVIHVHYRYAFLTMWVIRNLLLEDIPIVFHCHNAWMSRKSIPLYLRFYWFLDTFSLRKAEAVVALSEPMKNGLIRFHHAVANKIFVISNGVELLPHNELTEKSVSDSIKVVCVANLMPLKNQEILLDALFCLRDFYSNIKLILIGEIVNENYFHVLRSKVQKFKLGDNVLFTGGINHEKVLEFLSTSDIAVLPSRFEGMSMAALEYLSSGIPSVFSRIPSLTSICPIETALFFDPENVSELVDCLRKLIDDYELRQKLSEKAKDFVASLYTWDKVSQRMQNMYIGLISSNPKTDNELEARSKQDISRIMSQNAFRQ